MLYKRKVFHFKVCSAGNSLHACEYTSKCTGMSFWKISSPKSLLKSSKLNSIKFLNFASISRSVNFVLYKRKVFHFKVCSAGNSLHACEYTSKCTGMSFWKISSPKSLLKSSKLNSISRGTQRENFSKILEISFSAFLDRF